MSKRTELLSDLARQALDQYGADVKAGSEPVYPEWARHLQELLRTHEQLVASVRELAGGLLYLGMKESAEPMKRARAALAVAEA